MYAQKHVHTCVSYVLISDFSLQFVIHRWKSSQCYAILFLVRLKNIHSKFKKCKTSYTEPCFILLNYFFLKLQCQENPITYILI